MKLLITTQKVDINDDVLGFMHGWIKEFAKNCEKVTVICLYEGEHSLPENVKVLSLGKEKNSSKLKRVFRFYKYIWQEKKNYNNVFVHMNQVYVILGGLFWRLWKKKIGFWYAHGHVFFLLRVAEKLSNIIFTSTESGFKLKSKKKKIVGQGIDVDYFIPAKKDNNNRFKIITVGRISPSKDYQTLIKATEILKEKKLDFEISIIGGAGLEKQNVYFENLKKEVKDKELENNIKFLGAIPYKKILPHLQSSNLFVSMSHTDSLDKVILEAMACKLPVLTCNESAVKILKSYSEDFIFEKKDYKTFADKIIKFINANKINRKEMGEKLREEVLKNHSTSNLILKILDEYKKN